MRLVGCFSCCLTTEPQHLYMNGARMVSEGLFTNRNTEKFTIPLNK